MVRILRVLCVFVILFAAVPPSAGMAQTTVPLPPNCNQIDLKDPDTGALTEIYLICMPPAGQWNGSLVVFAHGYVFANPLDPTPILPYDQLTTPDGKMSIPQLANTLGFGFAMTSYTKNGLAIQEGASDTLRLVEYVKQAVLPTKIKQVYLVGASEGGLITTLLIENKAEAFNGGMAICGPIGDFRKQINYWGDFRSVFDYLSADPTTNKPLLPYFTPDTAAVYIPPELMAGWTAPKPGYSYQQAVLDWLGQNPAQAARLIKTTNAPLDPLNPGKSLAETTIGILTYNIMATNEARQELSKDSMLPVLVQPYDNTKTVFSDPAINKGVTRYTAVGDIDAIVKPYQTTGKLTRPLVTMHTLLDPVVPAWHQLLYSKKVLASGSLGKYAALTTPTYGHCNFNAPQLLFGFGLMVFKSTLQPVSQSQARSLLTDEASYQEFVQMNAEYGDITSVKLFLPAVQQEH